MSLLLLTWFSICLLNLIENVWIYVQQVRIQISVDSSFRITYFFILKKFLVSNDNRIVCYIWSMLTLNQTSISIFFKLYTCMIDLFYFIKNKIQVFHWSRGKIQRIHSGFTSLDYQLPGCPEKRTICNRCCYKEVLIHKYLQFYITFIYHFE